MMIAASESANDEAHRKRVARLKQEAAARKKREKICEEITFDSSMARRLHPRLFKPKVSHITDLKLEDSSAVSIDGEYFLEKKKPVAPPQFQDELPSQPVSVSEAIEKSTDDLLNKVDQVLAKIGF